MKHLKIKEGKGCFSINGTDFLTIDQIKKEDVLLLVDTMLDPLKEFEMDPYSADLFKNPAHKVIYENLFNKFSELESNKSQFISEIDELYQDVYDRYKTVDEN